MVEDPLGPPVVGDVGRGDGAAVVVTEAEACELPAHIGDVGFGVFSRVDAGLACVLLGGQTEGVVAHGVQHVETGHALEAGVDIGADEPEWVPDVQPGPRRIREHVHDEQLGPFGEVRGPIRWTFG